MEQSDAMQEFEAAVRGEDLDAIRRLHEAHPEVRERINDPVFDFDAPAIVWATGTLNEELIRLLVELGADIDARSAWENGPYSALHHACGGAGPVRHGLADTLVELGATIDLHSASGLGRLDLVTELLDAKPDRIAEPGPDGATPLHMAGNREIAGFLLGRGAPIDQPCVDHKSTPAMWAVAGRRDVSAFLVERGARPDLWMAAAINDLDLARRLIEADPEAINARPGGPELAGGNIYIWHLDFASSPLEVARRDGSEAMYQLLLAASPPGLKMLEAALADDLPELTRLADAHPPGDLSDAWVREVLCQSAAMARILLDRGANPDALNSSGQAAMHHAAWESDLELLGVLLDAGANGVLRDGEHNGSPWGWAEFSGQTEAQEFLEARGCLDGFDAIAVGRVDVVQAWLASHPDQLEGGSGISPLRTAALNGQAEIVALLLEAGADPAARSQATGVSALWNWPRQEDTTRSPPSCGPPWRRQAPARTRAHPAIDSPAESVFLGGGRGWRARATPAKRLRPEQCRLPRHSAGAHSRRKRNRPRIFRYSTPFEQLLSPNQQGARMQRIAKLALFAGVLSLGAPSDARAQESNFLAVGEMAPDIEVAGATRHGVLADRVNLSDYRGETVVLAFFFRVRTRG